MTRLRAYGATWFCGPREGARCWRRLVVLAQTKRLADRLIAPHCAPGPCAARIDRCDDAAERDVAAAAGPDVVMWRSSFGGVWSSEWSRPDDGRLPPPAP